MVVRPLAIALVSAALFGAATPASKLLLSELTPFQLAGLLYIGAALGVAPVAWRNGGFRLPARSDRTNQARLLGAVLAGGILGPVLLLLALRMAEATSVSLWLNFEAAATAFLGVLVFREHLGWLGWAGVACAMAAGALLSWSSGTAGAQAGLLVLLACVCWGLDNHLTALIDGITPSESTFWKGLIAGLTNLAIGLTFDSRDLAPTSILVALFVGIWAYGVSIVLYITSAQTLGATRAQLVFASAPFFGVLFSVVVLRESLTSAHLISGALFVAGIAFFAVERHGHAHAHESIDHEHAHRHDDGHHLHDHPDSQRSVGHVHRHHHDAAVHRHPHWPDMHHRHDHDSDG